MSDQNSRIGPFEDDARDAEEPAVDATDLTDAEATDEDDDIDVDVDDRS